MKRIAKKIAENILYRKHYYIKRSIIDVWSTGLDRVGTSALLCMSAPEKKSLHLMLYIILKFIEYKE